MTLPASPVQRPVVLFRMEIDNFQATLFIASAMNIRRHGDTHQWEKLLAIRRELLTYRGPWVFQVELVERE